LMSEHGIGLCGYILMMRERKEREKSEHIDRLVPESSYRKKFIRNYVKDMNWEMSWTGTQKNRKSGRMKGPSEFLLTDWLHGRKCLFILLHYFMANGNGRRKINMQRDFPLHINFIQKYNLILPRPGLLFPR